MGVLGFEAWRRVQTRTDHVARLQAKCLLLSHRRKECRTALRGGLGKHIIAGALREDLRSAVPNVRRPMLVRVDSA
jgi:hypothetical protein